MLSWGVVCCEVPQVLKNRPEGGSISGLACLSDAACPSLSPDGNVYSYTVTHKPFFPSPRRRPGSSLRMDMDYGIRRNDDGRSVVRQNEASAYSPGTWFAGMTIEEGLVHETQRSLPLPSPLLHCSSPRRRPGSSLRMDMDSSIRRNDDSEIFSTRRRCRYPSRRSGRGFCGITTRRK